MMIVDHVARGGVTINLAQFLRRELQLERGHCSSICSIVSTANSVLVAPGRFTTPDSATCDDFTPLSWARPVTARAIWFAVPVPREIVCPVAQAREVLREQPAREPRDDVTAMA